MYFRVFPQKITLCSVFIDGPQHTDLSVEDVRSILSSVKLASDTNSLQRTRVGSIIWTSNGEKKGCDSIVISISGSISVHDEIERPDAMRAIDRFSKMFGPL
jgi:hypothetical protein